jgi:hypothetical protein
MANCWFCGVERLPARAPTSSPGRRRWGSRLNLNRGCNGSITTCFTASPSPGAWIDRRRGIVICRDLGVGPIDLRLAEAGFDDSNPSDGHHPGHLCALLVGAAAIAIGGRAKRFRTRQHRWRVRRDLRNLRVAPSICVGVAHRCSGLGWRQGDGALTQRPCSGFSGRRP